MRQDREREGGDAVPIYGDNGSIEREDEEDDSSIDRIEGMHMETGVLSYYNVDTIDEATNEEKTYSGVNTLDKH